MHIYWTLRSYIYLISFDSLCAMYVYSNIGYLLQIDKTRSEKFFYAAIMGLGDGM
jgi:hypothetical protein